MLANRRRTVLRRLAGAFLLLVFVHLVTLTRPQNRSNGDPGGLQHIHNVEPAHAIDEAEETGPWAWEGGRDGDGGDGNDGSQDADPEPADPMPTSGTKPANENLEQDGGEGGDEDGTGDGRSLDLQPAGVEPETSQDTEHPNEPCQPDDEGSWSIGLFRGPSPLNLTPIETWVGSQGAFTVKNPVITCASIKHPPSNFVADPFLWRTQDDLWHVFFETKTNRDMQGDIGVAESTDGGASWHYLGLALDEPWHLSYPFIFKWQGQLFMLPESYHTGSLRLYRAARFPLEWALESTLVDRPLVDTSLVEWEGRWWMFGVEESTQRDLEVLYADMPLGPWQPHAMSPMEHPDASDPVIVRMAGRIIPYQGRLLRFAQDCRQMYGRKVVAYRIDVLTPTEYRETKVSFSLGGQPQEGAWNSVRHHHIDAQELADGSWVAMMDGDRVGKPWDK